MTSADNQPDVPQGSGAPLQFSLRTLLLVFVVLASSLAVFGPGGIVVFGLVLGLAIYLHHARAFPSLVSVATILTSIGILLAVLFPSVGRMTHRTACSRNLRQIAIALQNYEAANGCFPPAYLADKDGKPMHSWRVLILPYLEQNALYEKYDFNEPWDGPNNKKLLASRPKVYICPGDPDARALDASQTSYVAVVGAKAAWAGAKSRKIGPVDFPGGISNTVMLVEVANMGIAWTEPRDLSLDNIGADEAKTCELLVAGRHGRHEGFFSTYERPSGANLAMGDGHISYLLRPSPVTEGLRKLLQEGSFRDEEADAIGLYASEFAEEYHLNWPNIAALAVWLLSVGMLLRVAVRSRRKSSVVQEAGE